MSKCQLFEKSKNMPYQHKKNTLVIPRKDKTARYLGGLTFHLFSHQTELLFSETGAVFEVIFHVAFQGLGSQQTLSGHLSPVMSRLMQFHWQVWFCHP